MPLTEQNAAFSDVKKIGIGNVLMTEHHPHYSADDENIVEKGQAIWIVAFPEKEDTEDDLLYAQKLEELNALMRQRAGILEGDSVWYTDKICEGSIKSVFDQIESDAEIAQKAGFVKGEKNILITVVTQRFV